MEEILHASVEEQFRLLLWSVARLLFYELVLELGAVLLSVSSIASFTGISGHAFSVVLQILVLFLLRLVVVMSTLLFYQK